MGWGKRRWQDDEEAIARMQSRYAATGKITRTVDPSTGGSAKDGKKPSGGGK